MVFLWLLSKERVLLWHSLWSRNALHAATSPVSSTPPRCTLYASIFCFCSGTAAMASSGCMPAAEPRAAHIAAGLARQAAVAWGALAGRNALRRHPGAALAGGLAGAEAGVRARSGVEGTAAAGGGGVEVEVEGEESRNQPGALLASPLASELKPLRKKADF